MTHVDTTTEHFRRQSKAGTDLRRRQTAELSSSTGKPRRILVLSSAFPSRAFPTYGVFVKERVKAVAALPGFEVRVIAPVPYFPPIKWFKRWYHWSQFPREEFVDGLHVLRPRFFIPPKLGHYIEANMMYAAVLRAAKRFQEDWDFDLIDAHFAHPAGIVGTWLGHALNKPAVVTGRGEDMLRFPQFPVIGRQIRRSLRAASSCVAVSREIGRAMVANGTAGNRLRVIPNGVDCEKFRRVSQSESRQRLGLPADRPIVVSVGNRQERKGFHLLVEALPAILRSHPGTLLCIIGGTSPFGEDYTAFIRDCIQKTGMVDHVRLVGPCPHDELYLWYSAADASALLSSREGSPNVVLEALACGTPVVATPVGGICDELADSRLGIVLPERSAEAAATGIIQALSQKWDRANIRYLTEQRSWLHVAVCVASVFDAVIDNNSIVQQPD